MDRQFLVDYLYGCGSSDSLILDPVELDAAVVGSTEVDGIVVLCYPVTELIKVYSEVIGMPYDEVSDQVYNDTIESVRGLRGAPVFIDEF